MSSALDEFKKPIEEWARALVDGRDFCIPEDVRELAVDVLGPEALEQVRIRQHLLSEPLDYGA